ncbi:hypothetical protein QJQ45_018486 [Haematococcus lacustris]|nr:hypothetical protein QJQ45_018486 [Haematococcus lacustris]
MSPEKKRKRPVSHAPSAAVLPCVLCFPVSAGASGSGQQDVGDEVQAVKEVIGQRRQVIKAALRGLVKAARPDLSPAQVDAVVAEMNKRMTMSSKQCCPTACLYAIYAAPSRPKSWQILHRAAKYRRGIDGRARNNA